MQPLINIHNLCVCTDSGHKAAGDPRRPPATLRRPPRRWHHSGDTRERWWTDGVKRIGDRCARGVAIDNRMRSANHCWRWAGPSLPAPANRRPPVSWLTNGSWVDKRWRHSAPAAAAVACSRWPCHSAVCRLPH